MKQVFVKSDRLTPVAQAFGKDSRLSKIHEAGKTERGEREDDRGKWYVAH